MKCIILAAGYATRLYPLTENFPKPLLPVGGKPILDWLIEDIDTCATVDEYIVITNHKFYSHFEKWAYYSRFNITLLDDGTESNDDRLGAVKDIQFAIDKLNFSDDLLVIAGDNLLDFSLTKFIIYAESKKATSIMRFYQPDINKLRKCGVASVNDDDLIIHMEEKPLQPKSNWCTPPFYYIVEKDAHLIRTAIDSGCPTDAPGSLIVWLSKHTIVYAMEMPGNRYDIGNIQSYEQAKKHYKGITK